MTTQTEKDLEKLTELKMKLFKISKCIDCCEEKHQEEMYQNIALELTKELRRMRKTIEETYQIKACGCCKNRS